MLLSVVGTGIGVTAVLVSVIAIVANGINGRLNAMNTQIEVGKVGQRLETLERAALPQAPPAA